MNHWVMLPVVVPLLAAVLVLFNARGRRAVHRAIGLGAVLAQTAVALVLMRMTLDGGYEVYELGGWGAPVGIVLVLDRLSALMLLLTAVVALAGIAYAVHGADNEGRNFHTLYQLQLMGLNGAFLTGDLFNLFVCFEIVLIASYALMLHGGGRDRLRAGLHYVIYNLTGSALFLGAVGVIYGSTGTLNLADLAVRVPAAPPESRPLLHAAAALLLVVFGVKAALLPWYFWLPRAYSAASAPVAALFSIMTKLGIYAILRVFTLVFGAENPAAHWLLPLALATHAAGMVGVLASTGLRRLVAYLVVASAGTALSAAGLLSAAGITAAIYYMTHSALAGAALFLLADLVTHQRGNAADRLEPAVRVAQPALLGGLFFAAAVTAVGLPPMSGFLGKLLVLQAALTEPARYWVWAVVLAGGLAGVIALGRAGSVLFWKTVPGPGDWSPRSAPGGTVLPVAAVLGLGAALVIAAHPATGFADAAAAQLLRPDGYIDAVLGSSNAVYHLPRGGAP
ncbi:MAG: monovalent cation/H+ antiporter subunit D [Gammaproteobacteria bacterium]|nr:monovalent cation/H+ antiporter subunit D [Gammaproteobacteria bacterium]NIR96989.1 monovalent cation/H+ antiporter subunit D [Gammaproteobacteria bacterium]NIT62691.1 monovalent cation/H+ antiporter subunit D [Gammaproteobacteria bacterium]NIV19651.1 monovalent cation/H+ antiporter subunit D [Gammaproteobacteria bacterium]NIX10871.1 monovalent cation/H+ antiporter subunit D [Gammaproteobacteria bacterium]